MINKIMVVRVLAFLLVWVNQLLVAKGYQPLPVVSEEEIAILVTFVVSVWTLATDNKIKK